MDTRRKGRKNTKEACSVMHLHCDTHVIEIICARLRNIPRD